MITSPTLTEGGKQNIIYIDEGNLYRLIFKSRKKEAGKFQDWVMDEVLPTIRQTGAYSIPKTLIEKYFPTLKHGKYQGATYKICIGVA